MKTTCQNQTKIFTQIIYGDILHFAKIVDIAKHKMDYQVHLFVARSAKRNQTMHLLSAGDFVEGVQAEGEIWKGTYTSYAKGAPQDTHFKFLHGTHQTNWYLQKILRDRPIQTLLVTHVVKPSH